MAERDDRDDALLAAYVDGVGELTPEERKRVEATLDDLEVAGTRDLIGQLRALPPDGTEPDWRAMERRIAAAVDAVRTPWYRRWFVPAGALVLTAAALVLWLGHTPAAEPVTPAPVATSAHPVTPPVTPPVPGNAAVPFAQPTELWLDGQLVDVGDVDVDSVPDAQFDDVGAGDSLTADDGLLPTLRWVDDLDDRAVERAEHILEKKKS